MSNLRMTDNYVVTQRIVKGELFLEKMHLYETEDELNQRAANRISEILVKLMVIKEQEVEKADVTLRSPWPVSNDPNMMSIEFTYIVEFETLTTTVSVEDTKTCGHDNLYKVQCPDCGMWLCQDCEEVHVCEPQ